MKVVAPGKLILSGEHAVVHGAAALVTAVSRHASVTVKSSRDGGIRFDTPLGNATFTEEALRKHLRDVRMRYEEFLSGRRPIAEVVPTPLDFVALAWPLVNAAPSGIHLSLDSTIPLGSGMGSSAAVSAALLQTLSELSGTSLSLDDHQRLSLEMERFQHGHPSGVDSFIAVHGGVIRYAKGSEPVPIDLPRLQLQLVHTGIPESTTGQCVEQVGRRFADSTIWHEFSAICSDLEHALTHNDAAGLTEAVRHNHALLVEIGVVPGPVAEWIEQVEQAGGAAKICGAGSVRGPAGGMVWVVGDAPVHSGYTAMMVEGVSHGVHILH